MRRLCRVCRAKWFAAVESMSHLKRRTDGEARPRVWPTTLMHRAAWGNPAAVIAFCFFFSFAFFSPSLPLVWCRFQGTAAGDGRWAKT